MKHLMLIFTFSIAFSLLGTNGLAEEVGGEGDDLVLLVDFQEPGRPSNSVRVTIENRSKKPMKVIAPLDIKRPWGAGGWWYCGSYQFYLRSASFGLCKYACDQPQPPAAIPAPLGSPDIVELRPGQSIGLLVTLPLPAAEDVAKASEANEPPPPMPFWKSVKDDRVGKLPRSAYTLTVEYSPVGYGSSRVVQQPNDGESEAPLKLAPPPGQKIISNTLHFDVKKARAGNSD